MTARSQLVRAVVLPTLFTGMVASVTLVVPSASAYYAPRELPPYRLLAGEVLRPAMTLPVRGYHLTARFGDSNGPWASVHTGLDFAAPSGTPIHSIAAGVVRSAGYDGSYGNKTVIALADGTELWYCHQTAFTVSVGEQVQPGEPIGYVGSTGNVTGPHLHLEVHPAGGVAVDPEPWLEEHGLRP